MPRRNFIDPEVFEEILSEIPRKDGYDRQDLKTAYGDMSRLVVGWLARTSPAELRQIYNELGWNGICCAGVIHKAARKWYATYDPRRVPDPPDEDDE
jgi:hypothetical protein